jgi:hypothetical protein
MAKWRDDLVSVFLMLVGLALIFGHYLYHREFDVWAGVGVAVLVLGALLFSGERMKSALTDVIRAALSLWPGGMRRYDPPAEPGVAPPPSVRPPDGPGV